MQIVLPPPVQRVCEDTVLGPAFACLLLTFECLTETALLCKCRCVQKVAYEVEIGAAKIALIVAKAAADLVITGTSAVAVTVAEAALEAAQLALHAVSLPRRRRH